VLVVVVFRSVPLEVEVAPPCPSTPVVVTAFVAPPAPVVVEAPPCAPPLVVVPVVVLAAPLEVALVEFEVTPLPPLEVRLVVVAAVEPCPPSPDEEHPTNSRLTK